MTAISLRQLRHNYGRFTAIDDITFDVPDGAIYGLIGPNGAGKTTTIRAICTLVVPSAGDVLVRDRSVRRDARAIRRLLGYMPDVFGLYGELRLWEYLDFFARCYQLPPRGRGQAIHDVLELVDLSARRDSYVNSLSRGMVQRLALARTLLHDPDVLVLDEPAAGLDPRARIELRELLRELQRLGKTILLSSHILADLAEICSHVAILERGRLAAQGTLTDVLATVRGGRTVIIEVLTNEELPAGLAGQLPELTAMTMTRQGTRLLLRGRLAADEAALVGLLTKLVRAGLPVVGFHEERSELEEVFMQLTQPLVS